MATEFDLSGKQSHTGEMFGWRKQELPTAADALPGRTAPPYAVGPTHVVLGTSIDGPWPDGAEVIHLAMGCFWGAEKLLWQQPGVITTAVGYMGGFTPHPTYEECCTGCTGHAETVRVVYDPDRVTTADLLGVFWENHDPTQGMRQGNDVGTAYRSAIYWTTPDQRDAALATRDAFQEALTAKGFGAITTEVRSADDAGPFYLAEDYHQGYLHKNPAGYCPIHATGVTCRT